LARAFATAPLRPVRYAASWSEASRFGPKTWFAPAPTAASTMSPASPIYRIVAVTVLEAV
jgi:hypothetical protein